jgi:prepilin-type N-terminal cleavage/methylation domain-containing protein
MVIILKNKNKQKGFTLIELLVVISIVGILSSVVLAATKDVRAKAKNTKFLEDLIQLRNALELYRNQFSSLPVSYSIDYFGNTGPESLETGLASLVTNKFIPKIPHHPDWPQNKVNGSNSKRIGVQYQNLVFTNSEGHYAYACGEFDNLIDIRKSGQQAWLMVVSNDSSLNNIKWENKFTYCYVNEPSDPDSAYCEVLEQPFISFSSGDGSGFKTYCIPF